MNIGESILKDELLKVYNIYIQGFKNDDMNLINSVVNFPFAVLKDGVIEARILPNKSKTTEN